MGFLHKLFSRDPTRDQFAQLVLRDLTDRGVAGARYDKEGFAIHLGTDSNIFLDNTYLNYCKGDKRQRAEALAHLTAGFAAIPKIPNKYAAARPNLLPLVRDAAYSSLSDLTLRSRGIINLKPSLFQRLTDGIVTMLAYDTEHSIMQITQETFGQWEVPFGEAFGAAVQNLRDRTDTRLLVETEPGVYRSRWGDSYDSARILLTDLVYRLSLNGDPVAFIPNRDQLWITGHRNTQALQAFIVAGEETHFAAHPLSAHLYVLADGKWRPFLPDEPTLRTLSVNLICKRAAVDYQQQEEALEAIHAKSKTDIFVASCIVFKDKAGRFFSQTVWSNGIDSLLPETDRLTLNIDPAAKNFLTVPWKVAFPLLQDLMERDEGLAPVRYRVRAFPGADRIAKLRAATETTNT